MDWNILTSALTGLLSGTIGSLIAPWVNWRIERVRLKTENQRNRIAEWRQLIGNAKSFKDIQNTQAFTEIKQYMTKEDIESLSRVWMAIGGGNGESMKLTKLMEVVNEIEKEWDLI